MKMCNTLIALESAVTALHLFMLNKVVSLYSICVLFQLFDALVRDLALILRSVQLISHD